ncbi:MAG: type II toxin-antitoxin system prevent-host-death family antitoxin [Deltaproteobacteria bacterium]|nr:type II toxin-antitoxin system prevent-host-death family antitoxin [Deltaproteobacteria bacterium]
MGTPRPSSRRVVGARELKTRLGRYLRAAREGAIITVTDRGQPIAHLVPLRTEATDEATAIEELAAIGLLTKGSGEPLPRTTPARVSGEPIEETIRKGREDRS